MIFTAMTKEELSSVSKKYRTKMVGLEDEGEVLQPALCPECAAPMMESMKGYLSCTECGILRKKRLLERGELRCKETK